MIFVVPVVLVFSFNDPATTEIYTLSLHDALPISADLRGQARLKQIVIVRIDADHPRRATAFHLDGVKAAIATDVENRFVREIVGDRVVKALPLHPRLISMKMLRGGLHARQIEVRKPGAEPAHLRFDLIVSHLPPRNRTPIHVLTS